MRTTFGSFAAFGDTVTETRDGITYTVRIEHDAHHRIDDDDTHNPDRSLPIWEGVTDEQYERAMEARAAFFRNEWHYVGLVVSAERDGWERDHVASLWGIEANYPGTKNEYLDTVAGELIEEAQAELAGLIGSHEPGTAAAMRHALGLILVDAPTEEPAYEDWGGDTERAENWGGEQEHWRCAQIARGALCDATDADECATVQERSVAGVSDRIPACPAHSHYVALSDDDLGAIWSVYAGLGDGPGSDAIERILRECGALPADDSDDDN